MKSYIFFYFMNENQELVRNTVPHHSEYWKEIKTQGGPFADYSGGSIQFNATSDEESLAIINNDPFIKENVLKQYWLKEWILTK